MFVQMVFDTENAVLAGADHLINNPSLKPFSIYYEVVAWMHNKVNKADEVRKGKSFLEAVFGYFLTIPEFEKAKFAKYA
jgi:hypothetical protein